MALRGDLTNFFQQTLRFDCHQRKKTGLNELAKAQSETTELNRDVAGVVLFLFNNVSGVKKTPILSVPYLCGGSRLGNHRGAQKMNFVMEERNELSREELL